MFRRTRAVYGCLLISVYCILNFMKITIVSGSTRANSQSLKVANWLQEHAGLLDLDATVVDLHAKKLPVFDLGETPSEHAESIVKQLEASDAFVLVSPEWNGMMSHAIVNLMHFVGASMAHKPVMLVGVSAGRNGHYPLMDMRTMGYKNTHLSLIHI